MAFEVIEVSEAAGKPIELFTFARDYQVWRFTSADRDIVVGGAAYEAIPISRTSVEASAEMARTGLKVTAPRDNPVADLYRVSPPTLTVTLIVQQVHDGDTDVVTIWTGRVTNVEFDGPAANMTCDPVYTALRRVGLRRIYQKGCPHVLYGPACKANREAFVTTGPAVSIVGGVVQVDAADTKPDGWFAGGFIEYAVELGLMERRFITDHTGDTVTVNGAPYGLEVGDEVKIYPGCDHTLATCDAKFVNTLNYGGFPYFTVKNPFGGDPVY